MMSVHRFVIAAGSLGLTMACASLAPAQRAFPAGSAPAPTATTSDDTILAAFRALFDDVIGDSADTLCVGIADRTERTLTDPSPRVLRALRATGVAVWAHSTCVADEANYGPTRGAIHLLDVQTRSDSGSLLVVAEAVADRTARYECVVPRRGRGYGHGRCELVSLRR